MDLRDVGLTVEMREPLRAATKSHDLLMDDSFEKSKFSFDARFCNGKEKFESNMRIIEWNTIYQRG